MTDKKAEREKLQAEALKANLRRRKSQARAQKEAASVNADTPENPPQSSDGTANP